MKKSYKINLKNNSVAIYSPDNFDIKEGSNFLEEKLYIIKDVEKLINNCKMIVLMVDEACECTFHFSDESIDENILNNYYSYLKRAIEVKDNTLLITDTRKLENYSSDDSGYKIELENGYYNLHIFSKYDNNVYIFFEKVQKKPKLNVSFCTNYEIITKKENKRMILSTDYNNFMLKNYVFITKEEIDNKFIKDKNNFVYNLGTLNITSGKIAIFNPLSVDDMDTVIDEEDVLDRTVEIGKYNVLLAMRKTDYGTYITGVKIVFKPDVVEKYELAETTSNKTEFVATQYYNGICDFDTLEKYNNIFQSFKYLPAKENKLIKDFDKNNKKHKDIIDKYNYFMLWDIPTMIDNIALINVQLGITSYKAYYGLDKDDKLVEIVIPFIKNEVFKHKRFEIRKNKDEFVNNYIVQLRELIKEYIDVITKENNNKIPSYIGITELISCKIEEIVFCIIDLNLSKEAITPFLELITEFPNIDFYTKSDAIYYLIRERYDCNNILYETILKEPTPYKIYLLARYLYETGINSKENKCLLKLLKQLKRNKNLTIKHDAKRRYAELIKEKNKKIKKAYNIIFYIIFILLMLLYFI